MYIIPPTVYSNYYQPNDEGTQMDYANLREWCYPGDIVINDGKKFKVIRQMSNVNYLAEDEQGRQWKLRINRTTKAPEGTTFTPAPKPEVEQFHLGDTIRFTGRNATRFPGTWVIIKSQADDKYNAARLNGRTNEYVRSAHASTFERVTL